MLPCPGCPPLDLALEDRLVLFVAGDDAEAKQTVCRLIEQIGFTPVDTGTYNRPMRPAEARVVLSAMS